jgi:hypothetical protein
MLFKSILILSETTTNATSALSAFQVEVFAPKRMPSQAMHSVENGEIHSAYGIHLWRNSFKVQWIYASAICASMIYLKSLWNVTKEEFIRKAMGVDLFGMRQIVAAVSSAVTSCYPKPAAGFSIDRNLLSKTLRKSVNFNPQHTALMIAQYRLSWGIFLP